MTSFRREVEESHLVKEEGQEKRAIEEKVHLVLLIK